MNHIVCLSGGKDSTAMALRLKEVEPRDYIYICTPTGDELPPLFNHLNLLEERLEQEIIRLHDPEHPTIYDLIDHQAKVLGDKPYILHEDQKITFAEYSQSTCRAANGLSNQGARPGDGVAILMGNCPEYLYLFYGMPRGRFYSVPINVALKGDGLQYILTHSDVKYLVIDDTLYEKFSELKRPVGVIEKVFVRRTTSQPVNTSPNTNRHVSGVRPPNVTSVTG